MYQVQICRDYFGKASEIDKSQRDNKMAVVYQCHAVVPITKVHGLQKFKIPKNVTVYLHSGFEGGGTLT